MNILVVFDTAFGCTRQVARVITCALESYGTVECREAVSVPALDVQGVDLLILGGPTQSHGLSPAMRNLIETIPAHMLQGVTVAAFDTLQFLVRLRRPDPCPQTEQGRRPASLAGQELFRDRPRRPPGRGGDRACRAMDTTDYGEV